MTYISTRDPQKQAISASEAIVRGLAPDGGLYVPTAFPKLENYIGLPYNELALNILKLYLTDFSEDELATYIEKAYEAHFPVKLNGDYLELYHGKTLAFKDVALQLYPYLLTSALKKQEIKQTAVILTATSGDTGSAVLSGIANVEGTKAIVFYPEGGVSETQRLQMTTQDADNVHVFAIKGNFDDAQTGVKEIFGDLAFREIFQDDYFFTSANSINLGRLLPQVVYYFYAYSELVNASRIKAGDKVNFVVPTGNFGNILASYYAAQMGLPVGKLICATNKNDVLDEFFKTGEMVSEREFYKTYSPSMDILISSNLERLTATDGDLGLFDSDSASNEETLEHIKAAMESEGLMIDPHTAVGRCAYHKYKARTGDETPTLILSTAHPYKFAETVELALGETLDNPPADIKALKDKLVVHTKVTDDLRAVIKEVLETR